MSNAERKKPEKDPGDSNRMSRPSEYYESAALSQDELSFQREGLPPDYRMRHDEHYVDELIAAGSMPQLRLVAVSEIQGAVASRGESLDGLIDSIQAYGVLQPLLVRRHRGRYELLAGSKRLAAALGAGLKEVPCLVHEVDDVEARRLAEAANRRASQAQTGASTSPPWGGPATELLEGSLQTILSTLGLLDKPESSLRDHVAVGLIRAEAMKSNRLLHGLQILSADPPLSRRLIDAAGVLRSVLVTTEDERGLLGIELEASIIAPCPLHADHRLAMIAFAGAVESVLALVRTTRGARLAVKLAVNELARTISLVVSEDAVRMPTASWSRWFDAEWEERPGGFAAAVSLLAAKRAVELHDGRLELSPTDAGGCQLTLSWPSEA